MCLRDYQSAANFSRDVAQHEERIIRDVKRLDANVGTFFMVVRNVPISRRSSRR